MNWKYEHKIMNIIYSNKLYYIINKIKCIISTYKIVLEAL